MIGSSLTITQLGSTSVPIGVRIASTASVVVLINCISYAFICCTLKIKVMVYVNFVLLKTFLGYFSKKYFYVESITTLKDCCLKVFFILFYYSNCVFHMRDLILICFPPEDLSHFFI